MLEKEKAVVTTEPDQSDVNHSFAEFLLRLDTRLIALELVVAHKLHKNPEQREAFHREIIRKFDVFYEMRLKESAKNEPLGVVKIRAFSPNAKDRQD